MSAPEVDPHMWPDICRASLLAQLKATTAKDDADGLARLLGGAS